VHQQIVGLVVLLAFVVGHAGSHGHSRHACSTDQGVDLTLGEEAHQLTKQQTAGSSEDEGRQTEHDDAQGLAGQEGGAHGGSADGDAQEDGDDIHQSVLSGIGQTIHHAAFLHQVTQHQAAQKRSHGGQNQAAQEQPKGLVKVKLTADMNRDVTLEQVKSVLKRHPGQAQVLIYLPEGKTLRTDRQLWAEPDQNLAIQLAAILGKENVKVERDK